VTLTCECRIKGALISKRLSIRGWPAGAHQDVEDTLRFAEAQGIKAMVVKFPLDRAQEAYEHMATARFRAVIVPE
jgi:D-arabinose 1-dehydrogenase-like Zn-dependent alcohol dehydrogenase